MESLFHENEIVWAKINGYPWWPAYVKTEVNPSQLEVVFFGDFSRAILHKSKIRGFDELSRKASNRNKVLATALKSAEKVRNGESTIMDEWHKLDKSMLLKYPSEIFEPPKKQVKKITKPADEQSVTISEDFRARCQETDTKVEVDDHVDHKCSLSANNNTTSNTCNIFIDNKTSNPQISAIEEQLEDFWLNLRNEDYKSDTGIALISSLSQKILSINPKVVFPTNVGLLLTSCADVCKSRAYDEHYRKTFDALAQATTSVCNYLITKGFLMENKSAGDLMNFSKVNSIFADVYPDMTSPGLFHSTVSPVNKEILHEMQVENTRDEEYEEVQESSVLEIEERIQFRIKKKLARLVYCEEEGRRLKKRPCEDVARYLEDAARKSAKSVFEYKVQVLNLVKALSKNAEKVRDIVLEFQNNWKIEYVSKEINKLTID